MNETIKIKNYFLRNAFILLVIISIPFCIYLFLWTKIDFVLSYILSILFVFIGLVLIFYYNRNSLESIKLKENEFEITFFNKMIFKRRTLNCKKLDIELSIKEEIIEIYKEETLLVKIHRNTVDNKEWDKLNDYFIIKTLNVSL